MLIKKNEVLFMRTPINFIYV